MIKGVDVSNYQAASGWEDGIDFAFTKITEGTSYVNPKWIAQRQTMRDAGLVVGFYHFARPGDMIAQADFMLDQVALRPGDMICFDWEDTGVSSAEKDAWISYVQGRTGHRVLLYCNGYFWKSLDRSSFAGDGLWIATAGYAAGDPPIVSPWVIHQYSTAGGLDHDVAQFDSRADMLAWAGGEDMALTTAEIDAVAKRVLTLDGVIANPNAADAADNPYITLTTAVRNAEILLRRAETRSSARDSAITALATVLNSTLSQAQSNGTGISELKLALAALDLAGLANQAAETLAAKLEHLKFTVTEEA